MIAAVGTEPDTWGSAATVTVRRGSGRPASVTPRRNLSSGRLGRSAAYTNPVAAAQHWLRGGGANGVVPHGASTRTMTLSAHTPRSRARRSFSRTHRSWWTLVTPGILSSGTMFHCQP